jgi:hypothetical protein
MTLDLAHAAKQLIDEHWEGAGPRLFDIRIPRGAVREPKAVVSGSAGSCLSALQA